MALLPIPVPLARSASSAGGSELITVMGSGAGGSKTPEARADGGGSGRATTVFRYRRRSAKGAGGPPAPLPASLRATALTGPIHPPAPAIEDVWRALPERTLDVARLRRNRVVADDPDQPASAAFGVLRTRLLQALEAQGRSRVALTAPTRGCGTTGVAANLALSLARLSGIRVVLVDLDLRQPALTARFGLAPPGPIGAALESGALLGHLLRVGPNLALGLNDTPHPDAAERLQSAAAADALDAMVAALAPDVVLYDLPPALGRDDVAGFLPQVDGVLLVADGTRTLARDIAACERVFEGRTQLFGVVLNRARGGDFGRYAFD